MNGVLVIDKPSGWTSFDVVAKVRGMSREKKIGHTGTLDPLATGVLPLLLGRAVKAADLLPDTSKSYRADFKIGEKTDTGDVTGKVIESSSIRPSADKLLGAIAAHTGTISQIPPMYSAVSVDGKRLYTLARQGKTIDRESREIHIESLQLLDYSQKDGSGTLEISCSKGTYIRTLIEDICAHAGTAGVMSSLRRLTACGFTEKDALSLEQAEALVQNNELENNLRSTQSLFEEYPVVQVSPKQAVRFQNGGALDLDRIKNLPKSDKQPVRVCSYQGDFLGLAQLQLDKNILKMLKLFKLRE